MPVSKIKKAVIPAAGFGTRLFPSTKVVKKELFPVIDKDGRAKPVILLIIEEAISAGIEEIAIVVQPDDKAIFKKLFKRPPSAELFEKLSPENQKFSKYLVDIGDRITVITQTQQEGYGHAVHCAKKWVDNEPFLLMLGDHIYSSKIQQSCARQLLEIYQQVNHSVIGLNIVNSEILHQVGCVTGNWQKQNSILSINQVAEKPSLDYARENLHVEGLGDDEFLSIFGLYALTPAIFDCLEADINQNVRLKGEFQLTTCLDVLRQREKMAGYLVAGTCFDIGIPNAYLQTLNDFRNR
ncbi:UTP--glucose-1-phosphate uridylyltransferase [Calothrix sp. UHCC 0171]|uniref:UTP--glucose-1-phosphate uridylyltransferase n=1 Tax=Calothrix sp. UHCC 0171 TaxID=3110245 RepID=UPI002B1FBDAF|nr:UTP--glucose-1-phosphate uridylyltransferase [Calothrix sp. UHCC 0171]MEA5574563.1 UTP--glucose-1-phosphate uridylyltransferase [Calothrix sp. UHCC 0171]